MQKYIERKKRWLKKNEQYIKHSPSPIYWAPQPQIVGRARRESVSSSENTWERQPVSGKQDSPLAMASWLVYLLTGWGRGWTYGLLKHGLVVGRPRHPKGWSWRALVPVSLDSSRLDSQSWTAVLQELAAQCSLLLPLPAAARDPTPILSQTQRWWGGREEEEEVRGHWLWGIYGKGLAAAGKLADTILLSWSPECGASLSPVAEGIKALVLARGHAGTVVPTHMDICWALSVQILDTDTLISGNLSKFKVRMAGEVRSGASVSESEGCQWPASYCSYLTQITALR